MFFVALRGREPLTHYLILVKGKMLTSHVDTLRSEWVIKSRCLLHSISTGGDGVSSGTSLPSGTEGII